MNKIYVDFNNHKLAGDILGNPEGNMVLFLHGAGRSRRERFDTIRMLLHQKGGASCAFDFIGHGETGGNLSYSSLHERTEQACRFIEHVKNDRPLSIVAASMSGYTAVKLLEIYDIENIILLAPAAYDKAAYKLPFNEKFTECIRKERSYLNSDAWEILSSYRGKFMLVNAENDSVIPGEVIQKYRESAANVKVKKLITLKNSSHAVLGYMEENRDQLDNFIKEMTEMLDK